jgi:hypothetical protein
MTMPYKRTPGGTAPNSELEEPESAEGPETSL